MSLELMKTGIQSGLTIGGQFVRNGFITPELRDGLVHQNAEPLSIQRAAEGSAELQETVATIQRGEFTGNINDVVAQLGMTLAQFQRAVTSTDTAFPVRENLEAPARVLVPVDTPIRNMLARPAGAGLATAWRQVTSLGGGWGSSYEQTGGGSAVQGFYAEGGAIAQIKPVYAAKSVAYKRIGFYGALTGFAAAAGANYQDQMARQRTFTLQNTMLFEEFALVNGDSTSTAAPFGDGTNALSFDGIIKLTSTGNGTPSAQVQTSVGALTQAVIDAQLTAIHNQGGRGLYMLLAAQEILSLTHLCEASGSLIRVQATANGSTVLGLKVSGYVHPISGEVVDVIHSRFVPAGTMIFGARELPDGSPVMDVSVLPQVPIKGAVENPDQVQGYAVTSLARSLTDPDTDPFIITVYEALRLYSALHMAKCTGVTAV